MTDDRHTIALIGRHSAINRYLIPLLFLAVAAHASQQNAERNHGISHLPSSYRTPLSDMTFDDNNDWRAAAEEDNPWREGKKDITIKPRLKAEFFPEYDYDTVDDPTQRSLFQNEYELERPRTNIFKYTF